LRWRSHEPYQTYGDFELGCDDASEYPVLGKTCLRANARSLYDYNLGSTWGELDYTLQREVSVMA
jgi:hypothetical protein